MTDFITLYLDPLLDVVGLFFDFVGVALIAWSAVRSLYVFWETKNEEKTRRIISNGILLGLDYIVAGDVVRTIIMPYYYQLGILAGLVVIRTVLSYFLSKELRS